MSWDKPEWLLGVLVAFVMLWQGWTLTRKRRKVWGVQPINSVYFLHENVKGDWTNKLTKKNCQHSKQHDSACVAQWVLSTTLSAFMVINACQVSRVSCGQVWALIRAVTALGKKLFLSLLVLTCWICGWKYLLVGLHGPSVPSQSHCLVCWLSLGSLTAGCTLPFAPALWGWGERGLLWCVNLKAGKEVVSRFSQRGITVGSQVSGLVIGDVLHLLPHLP